MAIGRPNFGQAKQQTAEVTTIPAPSAGVDVRSPVGEQNPNTCIYTYNIMPSEYGLILRQGYREWQIEVETGVGLGEGVRSIFSYDGVETGAADDRLFAVTNEGIWDVTDYNVAPVLVQAFAEQSADAGYGIFCHYIDQSGEEFLFYADSTNGLFEYSQTTDLWARPTDITGPIIEQVCYVVVHKQRLWLIEENETKAWYLPVASKSGQATEFFFGSKFPHGGKLNALVNWSIDGGAGLDDYLVAISSSGDIVPYQGADPSSADSWSVVGSYFIGKMPKGRRCTTEYGGMVYMLSSYGLISMGDLLQGVEPADYLKNSLTNKVAYPIRQRLKRTIDQYGWEAEFVPSNGILMITSPKEVGYPQIQYVMNIAVSGWGYWRGVPMQCFTDYDGRIFFGTADNRIMVMDVPRDDIKIAEIDPELNGKPVEFSMLTSFQRYGSDGRFKQVQYARPDFWSNLSPEFQTRAKYDYDVQELTLQTASPLPVGDLWDVGSWDNAVWGSASGENQHKLQGSAGIGRSIAIAIRGEASETARLLSIDVIWTAGGPT